jgi:hypothetical protein
LGDPIAALDRRARHSLPVLFDTIEKPIDAPRPLALGHAADVGELQIETLADQIAREDVRFVGILGSDVSDELFVAHIVRERAPNVQLFTAEGDLLYLHPQYAADLQGMWVATTYPLVTGYWIASTISGRPPDPNFTPWLFSSSSVEGTYRALRIHLQELDDPAELPKTQPPLWITAVGRSSYWVVDTCPVDAGGVQSSRWCILARRNSTDMHGQATPKEFLWKNPHPDSTRGNSLGLGPPADATDDGASPATNPWVFRVLVFMIGAIALAVCFSYCTERRFLGGFSLLLAPTPERDANATFSQRLHDCLLLTLLFVTFAYAAGLDALYRVRNEGIFLLAPALLMMATCVFAWWQLAKRDRGPFLGSAMGILFSVSVYTGLSSVVYLATLHPDPVRELRYERAVILSSGLSPFVPFALLGIGTLLALRARATRLALVEHFEGVTGFAKRSDPSSLCDLAASLPELRAMLRGGWRRGAWVPSLAGIVAAVLVGFAVHRRYVQTIDASSEVFGFPLVDSVLGLAFLVLVGVFTSAEVRFFLIWRRLRPILYAIASTPLLQAFNRLPSSFAQTCGLGVSAAPLTLLGLRYSLDQLRLLVASSKPTAGNTPKTGPDPRENALNGCDSIIGIDQIEKDWIEDRRLSAANNTLLPSFDTATGAGLSCAAGRILACLETIWRPLHPGGGLDPSQIGPELEEGPGGRNPSDVLRRFRSGIPSHPSVELAEDFVAGEITRFVSYIFAHLRNLLVCATVGAILLLLTVASYPFRPQQFMMNAELLGLCLLLTSFLLVLVQAERDSILSLIGDRTPNKVDFDATFATQLGTYAGLPLLTVLATQFPAFHQSIAALFQWIGR